MDLKAAMTEYEAQARSAAAAQKACKDMARNEESIENKILKYQKDIDLRVVWIREAKAELITAKERHRIALKDLQKTWPVPSRTAPSRNASSRTAPQVKQQDPESPIQAAAASSTSKKRNIASVDTASTSADSNSKRQARN